MDKYPLAAPDESTLDDAIADSFPASDPVAIGHCERPGSPVRHTPRESSGLKLRSRKLIGTFATVGFLVVYALLAMAVGGQWIVGRGAFVELVFYIIAGLLWLPAVMVIVRWMSRPD